MCVCGLQGGLIFVCGSREGLMEVSARLCVCVCGLQGGLIFVCGSREGLMEVSARRHNTDDIIATVLAVEPMKFIYRGRSVRHHHLSTASCCIALH